MKTVLTTLNAKYIHTSPALRWLYVANKDRFDISFKEYVIKEDICKIADDLLASDPDIIGVGVYIWNVEKTMELISVLKTRKPALIIIVGGPEVSYEPEHFLKSRSIDFVISGEGEFVLGELLSTLERESFSGMPSALEKKSFSDSPFVIESVSSHHQISRIAAKADSKKLAKLPSPYMLEEDISDLKNRLVYFETSRGCPYQCGYCLSSLEKGMRYFPRDYIFQNLEYLIKNGARQIKFLDRTFNLNKNHTQAIFDFLIQQHRPDLSIQFEIYADLLDDKMITYLNQHLPPHYFRFEIGIQSTYEPTNRAVNRKQNFDLLADNIRKLTDGKKIDLHLDLIAGLPYETYDRFRQSFNDVFALGAKEVQLGFLKMLRGTSLRHNAEQYGYQYNEKAPYEICSNDDLSVEDVKRIHAAEHALEKYWNSGRFKRTMQTLFDTTYKDRYFELFDAIGQYYDKHQLPEHGYHLEDVFRNLHHFLLSQNTDLFNELREDYYRCFKIRPHGFWENRMDKKTRKKWLYHIGNDKEFLKRHKLNRRIIEKQTAIDEIGGEATKNTFTETESPSFPCNTNGNEAEKNTFLLTVFCDDGSRPNPLFIHYNIDKSELT